MGCSGLLFLVISTIYTSLDPAVGERRLKFVTVDGMRQHFELGQALKKRYHGFLSEAYDRHQFIFFCEITLSLQIVVNSTDYDRTLMSAAVNLAAMYPPNESQRFNPNLQWQPIPIHAVQNEKKLLKFPLSSCPRFQTLLEETKKTPVFMNTSMQYKEFLQELANDTGLERISLESVWRIYDTLFCEKVHKLPQPYWVTTKVMETLQQLNDFGFMYLFGIHHQEEKSRLQGGVLLKHILNLITESTVSNKSLKMQAYSAHDITIVALQVALNVFNWKQPPYASCHIFELFQEDNGSFSVAMFFRNDSTKEPYPLALPGCTQHCPLEDFVRLTKPVISEDWEGDCGLSEELSTALIVAGCLLAVILLLFTIVCCQCRRIHKLKNEFNVNSY
ncbi:hypothetical protein JZ751_020561 [Albula glossodonta]|uniref:Lysosomal acid phosphatase n=1 Tax=Albula glossodonta TaxID=121402 RepID=A0A8T2PNA3_9TELE|nr:hypothetical protein JZ751_020561 [Albula glossodonta]